MNDSRHNTEQDIHRSYTIGLPLDELAVSINSHRARESDHQEK